MNPARRIFFWGFRIGYRRARERHRRRLETLARQQQGLLESAVEVNIAWSQLTNYTALLYLLLTDHDIKPPPFPRLTNPKHTVH